MDIPALIVCSLMEIHLMYNRLHVSDTRWYITDIVFNVIWSSILHLKEIKEDFLH